MKKFFYKLFLSILCSAILIGLLIHQTQDGDSVSGQAIIRAAGGLPPLFLVLYFLCQTIQTVLRAHRAKLLLKAGLPENDKEKTPPLGAMFEVTLIRGACADMLPMRMGELSYVALLNRSWNISGGDCLSSLSIGMLLDLLALLFVLCGAIAFTGKLVGSAILLAVVIAVGAVLLFLFLPDFEPLCQRILPKRLSSCRIVSWMLRLAGDMGKAARMVTRSGIWKSVILESVAIRFMKYSAMLLLFRGICLVAWPEMANASTATILTALIAAEGAASLPLPSFLSFGTYEAGGALALTSLGFGIADSLCAFFAMHILSQIIDYSLGFAAFSMFLWKKKAPSGLQHALYAILLAAVFSALAFLPLTALAEKQPASDSIGNEVPGQTAYPTNLCGRIVWSSNRSGSHDLYMLTLPEGTSRRLTTSRHADTYPRFSPDGSRIAFSRSRPEWTSHRNSSEWDVWVLDLASGKETLVAENAFSAVWTPDGKRLLYVKNSSALATCSPETPKQEKLLPFSFSGAEIQTPNLDSTGTKIAITVHRKGVWTGPIDTPSALQHIDSGCEITFWGGDSSKLLWMAHPGKQKNAVYTKRLGDSDRRVLLDLPGEFSHEYFPKTSANGQWLVFAASAGGHEHDLADYEIFLLKTDSPAEQALRITRHTANDNWPDIFLDTP